MSENEKKLRTYIQQVAPHSCDMTGCGFALLDSLLAEHRADVEQLTAERESWRILAETSRIRAESARDAALEEAAEQCTGMMVVGRAWTHDQEVAANVLGDASANIRAIKSQPAERHMRESEVRRALGFIVAEAGCADVVRESARRLSVDLDAERKKEPHDALVATDGMTTAVLDVPPGFRVNTLQRCARCGNQREMHGQGRYGVCWGFVETMP